MIAALLTYTTTTDRIAFATWILGIALGTAALGKAVL